MRTGEKVRHNGYMGEYLPTGSDKEPEPRLSEAELERAAWSSDDALPPDGDAVGRFWEEARRAAGFTRLDVVVGSTPSAMVPPPSWQFGRTARMASALVAKVVLGSKRATASVLSEYDAIDEHLPEPGQLGIACDGAGRPMALVRTDAVEVVPFDEVTDEHAHAEGGLTLGEWRRIHVTYLPKYSDRSETDSWPVSQPWPNDLMVLETISCIYPLRGHPH